ncbi:arsenic resistance N-acetyltransferase ArsN2 [Burkholderia gladioli]|uniref:arsenic resistance N-acetyltransferase ArsN2 n=1 Tax=Burkholderia gladioli TaxID=28095 RepID=UPI00163F6384|nr:arsenic resistance N-acetyltransferase ArsN2 [Burkholderia gladioli]
MNQIRIGDLGDCDGIVSLLAHYSLPVADLVPEPPAGLRFFIAEDTTEQRLMGCIGLQQFDQLGLVRSFAVSPDCRNQGVGIRLLDELYRHARLVSIRHLYLLTTTATAYLSGLGYQIISRDAVPSAIQHSAEFSSLCPASAVAMTRSLRASGLAPA